MRWQPGNKVLGHALPGYTPANLPEGKVAAGRRRAAAWMQGFLQGVGAREAPQSCMVPLPVLSGVRAQYVPGKSPGNARRSTVQLRHPGCSPPLPDTSLPTASLSAHSQPPSIRVASFPKPDSTCPRHSLPPTPVAQSPCSRSLLLPQGLTCCLQSWEELMRRLPACPIGQTGGGPWSEGPERAGAPGG